MTGHICAECGQRGHNRRNRAFHPNWKRIYDPGSKRRYARIHKAKARLWAAVRGECICGNAITEKRRNGELRSSCRECLDANAERKRRDAAELKMLRAQVRGAA